VEPVECRLDRKGWLPATLLPSCLAASMADGRRFGVAREGVGAKSVAVVQAPGLPVPACLPTLGSAELSKGQRL